MALLLEYKAQMSIKDGKGWTPLHSAAYSGSQEVVALLLAQHTPINEKDDNGSTPYDVAGTRKVQEVLREHGGLPGPGTTDEPQSNDVIPR